MEKFRTRRYAKQFLKENLDKGLVSFDIRRFSDNQVRIICQEIWKRNLLQNSRKKKQMMTIETH